MIVIIKKESGDDDAKRKTNDIIKAISHFYDFNTLKHVDDEDEMWRMRVFVK